MKIVHVLSYFKPDVAYQENYLTIGQQEIGNDVYVITSAYEPNFTINKNNRMHKLGEHDYKGVKILRIKILFEMKNRFIVFRNLLKHLNEIKPDLIFFHDHSPELLNCIRYVRKNPNTRLVVDIHSTLYNSMNSRFGGLYHKLLWQTIIKNIQKYYHKVFYVAPECKEFALNIYQIDEDKLELLPLPGDASLLDNYESIRLKSRKKLGVSEGDKVIFHTGKLPGGKKTLEVLEAFQDINNDNYKMFIAGSIEDDFKEKLDEYLNKDNRIKFLGWLSATELRDLFIGGDVLLQPGSLSNTFIDAICCGLPIILFNSPQGKYLTRYGNGFLVDDVSKESIRNAIYHIFNGDNLNRYRENSFIASEEFHYVNVAKKSVL